MIPRLLFSGFFVFALSLTALCAGASAADDKSPRCSAADRNCQMRLVETLVPQIEKQEWRDQTLRELAKSYAYAGQTDKAIALIGKISDNDTKAMTIRGIGMAAASLELDRARYDSLWTKLDEEAKNISHAPSQGIAYTYISMAQAFAGNDDAARRTAASMSNGALRNKAYGEAAEIQAGRGDLPQTLKSLAAIDAPSYKSKQLDIVSRIFLDKAMVEQAYVCASQIDNAYLKAKAIQRILNKGNAEEEQTEPAADLSKGF